MSGFNECYLSNLNCRTNSGNRLSQIWTALCNAPIHYTRLIRKAPIMLLLFSFWTKCCELTQPIQNIFALSCSNINFQSLPHPMRSAYSEVMSLTFRVGFTTRWPQIWTRLCNTPNPLHRVDQKTSDKVAWSLIFWRICADSQSMNWGLAHPIQYHFALPCIKPQRSLSP